MSQTTTNPQSPEHLQKQRRLSKLLDKLSVNVRNNNLYPPYPQISPAHTLIEPSIQVPTTEIDEMPLDLSMKSRQPPPVQPKEPVKEPQFTCSVCAQTFSVHDRLTKHMASRHKSNKTPNSARIYECEYCNRRFARSDMLTRHVRLHTGVKPYACETCSQVFSRSDHLTTHQRTHTGEKPYSCPACPYAACRRDMITRHMKTHTRQVLET